MATTPAPIPVNALEGGLRDADRSINGAREVRELTPLEIKQQRQRERFRKVQFDTPNLHKLFRLFDADNDNYVTTREFQSGLLAMGYKEAADHAVLDRIIREIDADQSGRINEDEFVEYFRRRKLRELSSVLQRERNEVSSQLAKSSVRVIDYGVLKGEFRDSGILDMRNASARQRLTQILTSPLAAAGGWLAHRRWIDVNGYHEPTMDILSSQLGLHQETSRDAGIFQRQKFEVLTPGASSEAPTETVQSPRNGRPSIVRQESQSRLPSPEPHLAGVRGCRAEDVAHAVLLLHALSASPGIAESDGSQSNPDAQHRRQNGGVLTKFRHKHRHGGCAMDASTTVLHKNPAPSLSLSQRTIFVAGDAVVVTVQQEHDVTDGAWKEVRERLMDDASDLRVNSSSAKYLAMSLVEIVLDQNYELRDALRAWLRLLEKQIRQSAQRWHVEHLYAFSTLAEAYKSELVPVVDALGYFAETAGGGSSGSGGTGPTGAVADGEGRGVAQGAQSDAGKGATTAGEDSSSLPVFFKEQHIFFKDLSDEVITIGHEVDNLISTGHHLHEFYRTVQDDRMNRTLYVLTLVTTVFVPAQFLTGLYGMNFEVMPELKWEYSYAVFWCVLVVLTAIMMRVLGAAFRVDRTDI